MNPKIAVVEDNPDNRMLVQALLEDSYEISEYETGVDAVAGLGSNIPDLI
jgi:CheY-like chemotaxis protein